MPVNCTRDALVTNGACFTQQNFSYHDQQAIIVYRLAQISDAITGSMYASTLTSTLLTDANNMTCGMSDDQMVASFISILNTSFSQDWTISFEISAVAAITKAQAATAIACLTNVTDAQLRSMQLLLMCKLFNQFNS